MVYTTSNTGNPPPSSPINSIMTVFENLQSLQWGQGFKQCLLLTLNIFWGQGFKLFIVNFEHILHLILVFVLLTSSMYLFTAISVNKTSKWKKKGINNRTIFSDDNKTIGEVTLLFWLLYASLKSSLIITTLPIFVSLMENHHFKKVLLFVHQVNHGHHHHLLKNELNFVLRL